MTNRTILAVKEAYEEQLMAIPGVTGVGIGLTKKSKKNCIKVFINNKSLLKTKKIPRNVEGYPVETKYQETFKPL